VVGSGADRHAAPPTGRADEVSVGPGDPVVRMVGLDSRACAGYGHGIAWRRRRWRGWWRCLGQRYVVVGVAGHDGARPPAGCRERLAGGVDSSPACSSMPCWAGGTVMSYLLCPAPTA